MPIDNRIKDNRNDKMVLELTLSEAQILSSTIKDRLNSGVYCEYDRITLDSINKRIGNFLRSCF
jgi:hypothetical protein